MSKKNSTASCTIQTQTATIPMGEMRNWARISRGQSPRLEGISLGPIIDLQAEHRAFLVEEAMTIEDYHAYNHDDDDNEFYQEVRERWEAWDGQQLRKLYGGVKETLEQAVAQICLPGIIQVPRFVWGDWLNDSTSLVVTRHPTNGSVIWAPDFSLPIAGEINHQILSSYTYNTQFGCADVPDKDSSFYDDASTWKPYSSELPMYAWEPEKIVIAAIFELIKQHSDHQEGSAWITMPWKSVYQTHPAAHD